MAKIRYVGVADSRKILKSSFQKVGVENQEMVTFSSENDFTAEVTQEAADYLTKHDSFKTVKSTANFTMGGGTGETTIPS